MSFYDNILGVAVPIPGLDEAMFGDRTAGVPQPSGATFSAGQPAPDVAPEADRPDYRLPAAPQSPGADPDHDAVLDQALRAAGAPPHYLDSGHFVGAANLMAKEGLAPEDAYDRVVLQSARDSGLVDDDDFHHAFGQGASDEVQRGGIPADVAPFAWQGAGANGGAPAGDVQARARLPGLGEAGAGDASAEALGSADRGSEWSPPVRRAAEGEGGSERLTDPGGGGGERGFLAPGHAQAAPGGAYAQAAPGTPPADAGGLDEFYADPGARGPTDIPGLSVSLSDSAPGGLARTLTNQGQGGEINTVGVVGGNHVNVPGGYQVTNGRLALTRTQGGVTTTGIFNITGNAYAIVRQRGGPGGRISVTFGSAGY
jgi:hypothetical protein